MNANITTMTDRTAVDALAALSTAAEAEFKGDYETTLRLLAEAHELGHDQPSVHAHVHWTTAKFFARHDRWLTAAKHTFLMILVTLF